jgi:hypothetical protein
MLLDCYFCGCENDDRDGHCGSCGELIVTEDEVERAERLFEVIPALGRLGYDPASVAREFKALGYTIETAKLDAV